MLDNYSFLYVCSISICARSVVSQEPLNDIKDIIEFSIAVKATILMHKIDIFLMVNHNFGNELSLIKLGDIRISNMDKGLFV